MGAQQICGCSEDRTTQDEVNLLDMSDSYMLDFRSQGTFISIQQTATNFTNGNDKMKIFFLMAKN